MCNQLCAANQISYTGMVHHIQYAVHRILTQHDLQTYFDKFDQNKKKLKEITCLQYFTNLLHIQ